MSLAEFKGSPNDPTIFKTLIGDTIKACFLDGEGRVVLLMTCGHAFVLSAADGKTPVFWHEQPEAALKIVAERREVVKKYLEAAKAIAPGIDL